MTNAVTSPRRHALPRSVNHGGATIQQVSVVSEAPERFIIPLSWSERNHSSRRLMFVVLRR